MGRLFAALFAAMVVFVCQPQEAFAGSPLDFLLVNKSSLAVHSVQIREQGDSQWSPNIIVNVLAPDMGAPIEFSDTGSTSVGDVQLLLEDGSSLLWEGLDFSTFTLLVFTDGGQLVPGDLDEVLRQMDEQQGQQ